MWNQKDASVAININIQRISVDPRTAHKNEEVVRFFPVVYSIKLRSQLDNLFIRATEEKTSKVFST
ncbi:hypothetical protein ACIQAA_23715 [Neobacillus sp. NPDC093182]|uniref:hypothetical protein n=1 Tax=Neobacillus sp. NPDC093182 TaxID=3364297 RepID=UPI0037FB9467